MPPISIKQFVSYDEQTGKFFWKISPNPRAPIGRECGWVQSCNGKQYRCINFMKKTYLAHRLAWWWMTGEMPPRRTDIDHANQDSLDNRISNLRIATRSQNSANGKWGKKLYRGVIKRGNSYSAKTSKNKTIFRLGSFATAEAAARAYDKKAVELFGEFARPNFP